MKTKIQQIEDLGLNTSSITRAITQTKEKYFDNDQTFFECQIEQLTGIKLAFSSLLNAQYTFLYVIQTIMKIHQNKEDRMSDKELIDYSVNKTQEHITRFDLAPIPTQRKQTAVIIKEREVVTKKTGELSYISKAYNIVVSNKDKPKSEIIAIIMEQLNVKKGTAHVYMSKIKRGLK